MTATAEPMTLDPDRPETWPVMSEAQVLEVLTEDMRLVGGVPTSWWGDAYEIVVATDDPELAARAADELCRRDLGDGYLTVAGTGVEVNGPLEAVLVGWPGSDHVEWMPAGSDAEYVIYLCLVAPAHPPR